MPNQRFIENIRLFFRPIDSPRRELWIKNSGNEKLNDINPTIRRVFCENHFDPKYMRHQFNRTILRKEAVPFPYTPPNPMESQEVGETMHANCSKIDFFFQYNSRFFRVHRNGRK